MDWKKTTKIFTLCVLSAMTPLFAGGRRGSNGSGNHHGSHGRLVPGTSNVYYEGSHSGAPTNIYQTQGEHHSCGAPTIVVQPRVVQSYQYTGQPLQVIYYVR